MKQIFYIFVCFLFLIFAGCSKQEQAVASSIDSQVAAEIEQIENIESFDDETIKSLAVIVRTKIKNENKTIKAEYTPKNTRIYNIVKETANETIEKDKNKKRIDYVLDSQKEWTKEIKKSEILKFLKTKNISLSNISNISPQYLSDGSFDHLLIGGKKITYSELSNNFDLPSNKVINIKNNISSITIIGEEKNQDVFNIKNAENLAKTGMNYKEILRNYYDF